MPKKRGRPPKNTPQSSNKKHDVPSRDVPYPQPFDLTQIDDDDLTEIDNLSPKQAEIWLKNLNVLRERIKGKSIDDPKIIDKLTKDSASASDGNKDLTKNPDCSNDHAKNVKQQWVEKKKPTQKDVDRIDGSLKIKQAIEVGTVPVENIASAVEAVNSVIGDGAPLIKSSSATEPRSVEEDGWTTVTRS
ncbi:hypothetical protein RIF29_14560 [Crotalaria pallida]|uniref:Uncharacterized protein n=1 Tax=Crotalaria pallida TaxID=3830 RepID=A0AAN9FI02_CROPI